MKEPTASFLLGDCLEEMRSIEECSVDAVVTDPPYCSGAFTEAGRRAAKTQGMKNGKWAEEWFVGDNMGTQGLAWLLRTMAVGAFRVLRDGGSLLVFCDWRMLENIGPAIESVGLRRQNLVIWNKGSAALGAGFRAQHECVLHFVKGVGVFHDVCEGNVITCRRMKNGTREHPTQKPIELMQRLIRVVAPPAGLVLDPFMGSGSTGVAAISEGRSFLGIEREPHYIEVAEKRCEDARRPTQKGIFA